MQYRREIDGLRAIAVLPVIFFHAGFEFFSGGYVGVDVFFVISGYLITTIILEEQQAGRFTILNFYERRARRILPALFFVMLCCIPFVISWMFLQQRKDFSQSLLAVSFFSSNILFWLETNYFAEAAELKPLLHTWSLAVEEQYYILFPVFILITWRLGRRVVFGLLLIVGLCSLALTQYAIDINASAAFYLLPTRLWELLVGSLVAYILFYKDFNKYLKTPGWIKESLAALGLVLILYATFVFDRNTPFPSLYTLVPTLGAALIVLFGTGLTRTGIILSVPPFVGIGLISYSAYLWHQPLFAFARIRSIAEPSEWVRLFIGLLALGLAYLTWKFIEAPFRNKQRFSRAAIFGGAAIMTLLFSGVGYYGQVSGGFQNGLMGFGQELGTVSERIRINKGLNLACTGSFTTSDVCRTGEDPELLVWGDSFAMHLIPGLIESSANPRFVQMTSSACAPILDLTVVGNDRTTTTAEACLDFNQTVFDWAKGQQSVKYAILATPFAAYLTEGYDYLSSDGPVPASFETFFQHLSRTVELLEAAGIQTTIVSPTPQSGRDIGACLVKSEYFESPLDLCNISTELKDGPPAIAALMDQLRRDFHFISLGDAMCDQAHCYSHMDGHFLYRDAGHLSVEGSAYLGKKMGWYEMVTQQRD